MTAQSVHRPWPVRVRQAWSGLIIIRNPVFGLLWTGQFLSQAGSWLLVVAVPVYVLQLTGSPREAGLAFVAEVLPVLLVGPAAGVFADRWSYRGTMIVSDVLRAGCVAAMVLIVRRDQVLLLLAAVFAENTIGAFFDPAHSGLLPAVTGRGSDLSAANAWYSVSGGVVRLIAGPAGGALYLMAGFRPLAALDAVSYLASAVFVAAMPRALATVAGEGCAAGWPSSSSAGNRATAPGWTVGEQLADGRAASAGTAADDAAGAPAARVKNSRLAARQFGGELRHGIAELSADRVLRVLLGVSTLFLLGNGALTALLVPYVVADLHARATAIGTLFAALGAGYLLSAYVGRKAADSLRLRRSVIALLAAAASAYFGFVSWHDLTACLVFIGMIGLSGGAFLLVRATLLERRAAPGVVGRISSAFSTAEMAATLTGAALASALVTSLGMTVVLNCSVAVVVAAAAAALALPARLPARPGRPGGQARSAASAR